MALMKLTKTGVLLTTVILMSAAFTVKADGESPKPGKKVSAKTIDMSIFFEKDFWKTTPDNLLKTKAFKWTSNKKDMLRFAAPETKYRLKLFGNYLIEALLQVKDNKLTIAKFIFYTRGDVGIITREDYSRLLFNVQMSADKLFGKAIKAPPTKLRSNARIYKCKWNKSPYRALMKWSYTGKLDLDSRTEFTPEYLFLIVADNSIKKEKKTVAINKDYRDEFQKNIVNTPAGDVYLDNIPMVDQGRKGYCVAATTERVLKYFGEDFDQHMIAQISGTTRAGTNLESLLDAMEDVEKRMNINVRSLYEIEIPKNFAQLNRVLKYYNKVAKKAKAPTIKESDLTSGKYVSLTKLYSLMRNDLYIQMRVKKDRNDYKHFLKDIKKYIDKGYPCVWTVVLGIVKEPEIPQASGGHQRLIIGYNEKTRKIIYSDSWGKGHEKKYMDMDNAWGITQALSLYLPRAGKYHY